MELYLVNYSAAGSEPCKSIMHLPKEEAVKLAEQLYSQSQCKAHKRFGPDFLKYYEDRIRAEQWLYENFIRHGGKPEKEHPYYFTLQPSNRLAENYDECKACKIKLSDISDADVSFTFGDSMALMYSQSLDTLYSKTEMYQQLNPDDDSIDVFLEKIQKEHQYIEAQLWTDRYFKNHLV